SAAPPTPASWPMPATTPSSSASRSSPTPTAPPPSAPCAPPARIARVPTRSRASGPAAGNGCGDRGGGRRTIGRVFVKICGVTNEEDALLAVAMDADAVGFIFAPSRRQIAPQTARDIARRLPAEALTVGVFRDEAPERVVAIVNEAGLRGAQLHGRETAEATRYVAERVPFTIKAFSAGDPALARADEFGVDAVMVDGARPGSGELWDWELLDSVPDGLRLILAGGLTPD